MAFHPTATNQVRFYAQTQGTVNYTWTCSPSGNSGSGSFTQNTANVLVTLSGLNIASGDTLTLSMQPQNLRRLYNANGGSPNPDCQRLINVKQWGSVVWSSMQNMFYECSNLKIYATNTPNLSQVTNIVHMFLNATSFNQPLSNCTFHPNVWFSNTFTNCAMDCGNYAATLTVWANNPNTPNNNRSLDVIDRQYASTVIAARNHLVTNEGWKITGNVLIPLCSPTYLSISIEQIDVSEYFIQDFLVRLLNNLPQMNVRFSFVLWV
ncbi:MAG: hypothetical protein Fur0028_16250 [Bacteroidales bacterium]